MAQESYRYIREAAQGGSALLFAFHGTGGDENQLLGLARDLMPAATVIAPRGDILEGGAARFFRRTGEGVYDMADLAMRSDAMAAFVQAHADAEGVRPVIGLGYSNGANILASTMFAHPDLFDAVVLMHPLIPFQPVIKGSLRGKRIMVTAGERDPICPPALTHRLLSYLDGEQAAVTTLWHSGGHDARPEEISAIRSFLNQEDLA